MTGGFQRRIASAECAFLNRIAMPYPGGSASQHLHQSGIRSRHLDPLTRRQHSWGLTARFPWQSSGIGRPSLAAEIGRMRHSTPEQSRASSKKEGVVPFLALSPRFRIRKICVGYGRASGFLWPEAGYPRLAFSAVFASHASSGCAPAFRCNHVARPWTRPTARRHSHFAQALAKAYGATRQAHEPRHPCYSRPMRA